MRFFFPCSNGGENDSSHFLVFVAVNRFTGDVSNNATVVKPHYSISKIRINSL